MPKPSSRFDLPINRRKFLRIGGGLALASGAAPHLAHAGESLRPTRPARSCILVYLLGGPSHIDMWDLKPAAPAEIRGPFHAIATATPGLEICEHMPRLARRSEKYAIVRSVSHHNHNHTPMIYYTLTGREVERPEMDNDVRSPQRSDFPHLAAIVAAELVQHARCERRAQLPGYVAIPQLAVRSSTSGEFKRARPALRGGGAGFLGPLFDPLCVDGDPGAADGVPALHRPGDVAAERLERRARLLSLVESRRPVVAGAESYLELRDQAVVLSGARQRRKRLFARRRAGANARGVWRPPLRPGIAARAATVRSRRVDDCHPFQRNDRLRWLGHAFQEFRGLAARTPADARPGTVGALRRSGRGVAPSTRPWSS